MKTMSYIAYRSAAAACAGMAALMILALMPANAAHHEGGAVSDAVQAAANASDRFEGDRDRDSSRHADQVLTFLGVDKGMHVLDLFSGGGYYAELISSTVGPDGGVTAHNNNAYLAFVNDELTARYTEGRLQNVKRIVAEANDLDVKEGHYDAVMLVLSYHDIYYVPEDGGWPKIDGELLLSNIKKALKPGGVLGLIDHSAPAGSSHETGTTTHRIDPAIVVAELEAAGFELDGELDVLRNPDDDLAQSAFAPGIRGKTDRFVYRFRKPS